MSEPMDQMDNSFDESDQVDFNIIASTNDYKTEGINVSKKLSLVFESVKDDEHMKVYLRVRPTLNKSETTIIVDSDHSVVTSAPDSSKRAQYTKMETRHYAFSKVFGPNSTQREVFDATAGPLLQKFMNGENCALFAYGMTNSGKTYTIQGSDHNYGIMPQLISQILDKMEYEPSGWELNMSMLEIYQENIYDLLGKKRDKLKICDAGGRVEVGKLSTHKIASPKDAVMLMDTASGNRAKSSTSLNSGSSRSHAMYTVTLNRPNVFGGKDSVAFQLIDLAGAERANRTKATATQQKEANNINTSLMQLWRCLQGIKNNRNKDLNSSQEMIPFRESKLTHLLMPILCRAGMNGIGMVACVNPQPDDYDETLSILGNASLASKIREITDVGRVAASQHEVLPPAPPVVLKVSSSDESGKLAGQPMLKKRRGDSTLTSMAAPLPPGGAHGPFSRAAAAAVAAKDSLKRKLATATTITAATSNIRPASEEGGSSSSSSSSEPDERDHLIKRLRVEVDRLTEENHSLLHNQLLRETEIRAEVCDEMAERSSQLLEENFQLRNKLDAMQNNTMDDVTKSVKKLRKNQLNVAHEGVLSDLKEAEEELERMRGKYDNELAAAKETIRQLSEKNYLLEKAHRDSAGVKEQQQVLIPKLQRSVSNKSNDENGVVNEYSQRFKKSGENNNSSSGSLFKPVLIVAEAGGFAKKSPTRSPLGGLSKNMDNSPTRPTVASLAKGVSPMKGVSVASAVQQINSKPAFTIKNINTSPLRTRPNTATSEIAAAGGATGDSVPYFTRLRSQVVR